MNGWKPSRKNPGQNRSYLAWKRKDAMLLEQIWSPASGQRDVTYSILLGNMDKRTEMFTWPNSPHGTAPAPSLPLLTTSHPKPPLSSHPGLRVRTQTPSTLGLWHLLLHLPEFSSQDIYVAPSLPSTKTPLTPFETGLIRPTNLTHTRSPLEYDLHQGGCGQNHGARKDIHVLIPGSGNMLPHVAKGTLQVWLR